MIPTVPDFTIAQLETLITGKGRLRLAGLSAHVDALDTGEVIAVSRPYDPNKWLWCVSPTEGGSVVVTALPSGAEHELPSVDAALEWIAAEELPEIALGA